MTKRGYQEKKVREYLGKADKLKREHFLQYKSKKTSSNRVPMVVTFDKRLPNIQNILHSRWNIIRRSKRLEKIYPSAPITAFRRDQNLGDILVHVKHAKLFQNKKEGTHPCVKECKICQHVRDTNTIERGKVFVFKDPITCKSSHIVYGIFCHGCQDVQYVGETGTTVYERMANHLSTIRKEKNEPIPQHFANEGHDINDFRWFGIEKMKTEDIHVRKIRESFWIKKLGTLGPMGLNQNGGVGDKDMGAVV